MKFSEYREIEKRGSHSFPIEYYLLDSTHSRYVMLLHWHTEFEIIHIISGELDIYINNEHYRGCGGDVFFVAPGCLHRAEPHGAVYECTVFDTRIISGQDSLSIAEYIRGITKPEVELMPVCPSAAESAKQLFQTIAEGHGFFELRAVSLLHNIFYELYRSGNVKTGKESRAASHRRSQMVLLFKKIDEEYTRKLSPAELAEFCGIDEKYLFRVFKEFTGCTPSDYINRKRIERATYLMTEKNMSATEASFESGYNELSYFMKVFKKYMGITPGKYKKRYRKG